MSNKSIKVNSLSYTVEFSKNIFSVGCQEMSFEDARKVAEFILEQEKEDLDVRFQVGGVYQGAYGVYVLVQVDKAYALQKLTECINWTTKPNRENMQDELNCENFKFVGKTVEEYYRELYNRT